MAKIAGMAFMAVHDGQGDAAIVRWCLIAFQASVDLVNRLPQLACIHLGVYVSHGFGAGHGMAQPMFPEAGCARHLQSVEASHPRPEQDYGRFGYGGRGDARFRPAVGEGGHEFGGEAEHLFRVCDQAPKQVRKNRMALNAKDQLSKELAPFGVLVDQLQVQQHRFDKEYQDAINAQKQAEADVQTLIEQQKNMASQKRSELEGKRSEWNKCLEDALGEAGRIKNEADGYYQTKRNLAKATIGGAQAEAEGAGKEAEALGKVGADAYVKMQVAKQFAEKKILIVPASNVSTMNVNDMVKTLLGRAAAPPAVEPAPAPEKKR